MMNTVVILDGDKLYAEELVRENARLTVQVEAERQRRRELEAALARLKQECENQVRQAEGEDPTPAETAPEPARIRRRGQPETEAAKGIVILHCEACGDVFTTFLKEAKPQFSCKCGGRIDLTRPMARFRYTCPCCEKRTWGRTNVEEPSVETKCLCGNPVGLTWNPRSREYKG